MSKRYKQKRRERYYVGHGLTRVPFKCEACGLKGSVENPGPMESITCPDCGARYLHYPAGHWRCVVRPVFA